MLSHMFDKPTQMSVLAYRDKFAKHRPILCRKVINRKKYGQGTVFDYMALS